MSSQHDLPISDASQTRQKSCILTPASDSSLNGFASGGKKRKRDGNTMEDLLKDSFIVKPHPSTVFDRPRTLQPLIILPRSQLPLSYLDITSSTNPLPQSRFFDAHVKILELEDRMGTQPMLLIAKLDDGKTLYAVEREDRGLYVLCQLGSWVDIQKLASIGTASNNEILATTRRSSGQPRVGLDMETVTTITIEAAKYSKKKRLAIEAIQSMVKRPTTDLLSTSQAPVDSQPAQDTQENSQLTVGPESFESQNNQMTSEQILGDNIAQPTASEIFENVRNQYFEALYLSKASLAYFAKGPLSRARAAFHLDYDSTLEMNDHISFLESLILSTTLIEKKYKDGVPHCVSLIDVHQSEEDADNANGKPKKKRISKKMKPGKTGLYPLEDVLIRRWWANYDEDAESGGPDSSREETTKRRIADLRIRETQLQMIVLLEVLALQPLASPQDVMEESLPLGLPSATKEEKEKPSKSKKPEHLTMLIDVHIDRLCIWQSIASGSGKIEDSQKENPSQSSTSANVSKHSTDVCRDFCVEVIAPFFSARLPELCSSMNRKLGGPIAVAPSRPRLLSKAASFSSGQSRPGAVTKRPVPPKPGQSLHRVLSETQSRRSASRGPSKAISLMRSASVTVPGLKREASEPVSLSNVPLADSHLSQPSRASHLARRRLSQREGDLSSIMPVGISKADKQAKVEAELKEAISALKKPNRELAGKVLAETADKRAATTSRSARKSKKPVRNPLFQTVQISATPKSKRSIDVFSKSQSQRPSMLGNHEEPSPDTIPPSSLPSIPRSAMQPSQELAQARNQLRIVQATPTRKSAGISSLPQGGRMDAGDYGIIPPSPLYRTHVRRSSAQLFPLLPTKPTSVGPSTTVQGTPVKKKSEMAVPASHSISTAVQETPVKRRPEIEAPAKVSITTTIQNTPIKQRLDIAGPNHRHPSSEKENTRMGGKAYPTLDAGADDSIYKSLGWDADDDIDDLA